MCTLRERGHQKNFKGSFAVASARLGGLASTQTNYLGLVAIFVCTAFLLLTPNGTHLFETNKCHLLAGREQPRETRLRTACPCDVLLQRDAIERQSDVLDVQKTLTKEWTAIIRDWLLPFRQGITLQDVNDALSLDPGKKVIFQHIQGVLSVYDHQNYCSAPKDTEPYLRDRCYAVFSILNATAEEMSGSLPDFEFVYDLSDLPTYRSSPATMSHPPMPGFGSVRCWQKGFMSFPMFGSHGHWDIRDVDANIAKVLGHRPRPFADRKAAAVFRGGLRGCSFPPDHNDMLDWRVRDAKQFYNGTLCGRRKLEAMAQAHPDVLDFANTDGGHGMVSMEDQVDAFKYVVSIEGYGGWTDRLFKLLLMDAGVLVQEHPCKEWYEEMFYPFQHYIPVSNDLSNLLGRIQWAERHPVAVEAMLSSRVVRSRHVLSKKGITTFSAVLWRLYADLQRYSVRRRRGSINLVDVFT